jgi:hypothetical protein
MYRLVIPLHFIILIFPIVVNEVYFQSLHVESSPVSVPPQWLLMFVAISTTVAWVIYRKIPALIFPGSQLCYPASRTTE